MRRINLVPPEVLERRRQRTQTMMLGVYGGVFLIVLFGIWLIRQGTLHNEQDRLAVAQAEVAALEIKVAALQEFAILEETVKQKRLILATAMANDIAWSRLLIELSMTIPGDSWLTSFNGVAEGAAPGAAPVVGAPARLGSLTFVAVTIDNFKGVAKWLTRLQEMKSLQTIWIPTATTADIGGREVINYGSTADLSPAAASGRGQPKGPQ
ncbi:MAG: hypothetical protein ABIS18_03770 [Actinomycetota bacterium]